MDAIGRANDLLERYAALALAELPAGTEVFDAHTHLGEDIDGMVGDRDELLAIQRAYRIVRSFVFCLDEPDRHPAFRAANDRTLAHAAAAPDELLPFVRLDLDETPIEEATRCIDLGARGIKLHPRAQRFLPDDPRLEPVFALAAERRVPVLIHGGRGLPPIADSLARLLDPPQPARADRRARRDRRPRGDGAELRRPSRRLLRHLRLEPARPARPLPPRPAGAGRLRDDYPYGRQPNSLLLAVRTARACGLDDDQLRAVLHDTAARIADGLDPVAPTAPQGPTELSHPVTFLRIHQYLTMASAMLWMRHPSDTFGVIGLGAQRLRRALERLPRRDRPDPRAARRDPGPVGAGLRRRTTSSRAARAQRGAFRLVHLASVLAVTTPASAVAGPERGRSQRS